MIVYSFLAITLLLAMLCIVTVWRALQRHGVADVPRLLLSLTLAIFIFLYGAWVFLSVYAKYVFAAGYVLAAGISLLRRHAPARKSGYAGIIVNWCFTVILAALVILYYVGTTGAPYGIARLRFPFRHGTYFVFQGGKGLPTNVFHYGLRGAVFAMDIVKLNRAGNRAVSIFSKHLQDYEIYGDTIYSPCDGYIMKTENNNPDNIPPEHKRGPTNTNQVLIRADSFYVFLGHLRKDGVFVHAGQTVRAGDPLGLAGNSGFSLEPHLHIQVHALTDTMLHWYREKPLQIAFDGKSYLLFEEISAN